MIKPLAATVVAIEHQWRGVREHISA